MTLLESRGRLDPDIGWPAAGRELVADGLTNSAIAARRFVSRATVSSHVTHILAELDVTSRAQIAAWVGARRPPDR